MEITPGSWAPRARICFGTLDFIVAIDDKLELITAPAPSPHGPPTAEEMRGAFDSLHLGDPLEYVVMPDVTGGFDLEDDVRDPYPLSFSAAMLEC